MTSRVRDLDKWLADIERDPQSTQCEMDLLAEIRGLRASVNQVEKELAQVTRERDEARVRVGELETHLPSDQLIEAHRGAQQLLDKARAEIERLTKERDELKQKAEEAMKPYRRDFDDAD